MPIQHSENIDANGTSGSIQPPLGVENSGGSQLAQRSMREVPDDGNHTPQEKPPKA